MSGDVSPSAPSWNLQFLARTFAACTVLVGLAMVQSPGLIIPDTKLDLAIAPVEFLERAAHLWDPEGAFGQLQNQAYGYLWPMGPFFALGSLMEIPAWVVQRLWIALVMCVALTGTAKLARTLGVRSDLACLMAGFAYALSPRMLTVLGPISIEAWPSALAPWVLLPLVVGSARGSPRRAAALSALAVAMVGGVNAAATSAVLPLGVLWLLTRKPGRRRRSMMLWWPLFTLLGTLWWLVPLFVMGAYSPPFLDFIESAANTTFPTNLFDALRGTSNWVPYVDTSSRAGNDLIREFYLILNSGIVLIFGLIGLMVRRNPHRGFLVSGLMVGLLFVTMGHTGAMQGWFASDLQQLLDGPLAPLRNVHKFDPVIRLPMVLGLAWAVDAAASRLRASTTLPERLNLRIVVGVALFAVAAASLPAATGHVSPADGFEEIPDYWDEAAEWLGRDQEQGVALLVPGSSFGTYVWGDPMDEPMQALATKPWAVRNAVPLVPAGNIRMLDAIEQRLAQGRPSKGLATYLRRAGISHLVVRNDLDRTGDIPDPVRVHQAIDGSPGLQRVATFGPDIGGEASLEGEDGNRVVINGGWQDQYPAIEVYDVAGDAPFATAVEELPTVVGGPEDLLGLADLGVLADAPVRLATDIGSSGRPDPDAPLILTDGLRAVERSFGRIHDATSATRSRGQERRLPGRVPDYLMPGHQRWATWARYVGAEGVSASSSQSDATAYGPVEQGQQPFAAVDGRTATEWVSGPYGDHWWQLDLLGSVAPGEVRVTGSGSERQVVRVVTEQGESTEVALTPGVARTIEVEGTTRWIRIEDASRVEGRRLRLAAVEVPGVEVRRPLVLPGLPSEWGAPDAVVLRAVTDPRTGCVGVESATRCVVGEDFDSEEPAGFARHFTLPAADEHRLSLEVRPRAGERLIDLITRDQPVGASASSVANPDVRGSAIAAIDGDIGTAWTAALSDEQPQLSLRWLKPRTIRSLELSVADSTAARAPRTVLMEWAGGRRTLAIGDDGRVRFPAIRASNITLTVLDAEPVTDLGFDGNARPVPVGISEVAVSGVSSLPLQLSTAERTTSCGVGPDVTINGQTIRTRVTASAQQLYDGDVVAAELCTEGPIELTAGLNRVSFGASGPFSSVSAVFTRTTVEPGPAVELDAILGDEVTRAIAPPDSGGVVSTRENANRGWSARQGDTSVGSLVTDGWRKSWVASPELPVRASFGPDVLYRAGLAAGVVALAVLAGLVLLPRRRWAGTDWPTLTARSPGPLPAVGAAALVGGLLGSWSGSVVAALGVMAGVAVVWRWRDEAWPAALLLVPSIGAYILHPWGDPAGWAGDQAWVAHQVLLALSAVLGVVVGRGRPPLFRRRKGSSSSR